MEQSQTPGARYARRKRSEMEPHERAAYRQLAAERTRARRLRLRHAGLSTTGKPYMLAHNRRDFSLENEI